MSPFTTIVPPSIKYAYVTLILSESVKVAIEISYHRDLKQKANVGSLNCGRTGPPPGQMCVGPLSLIDRPVGPTLCAKVPLVISLSHSHVKTLFFLFSGNWNEFSKFQSKKKNQ